MKKTPEDLSSVLFFIEKDLKDEIFSLSKGSCAGFDFCGDFWSVQSGFDWEYL